MALDPTKWTFRSDRSIRYVGPDHGAATHDVVAEVTAVRVESDESGVGIIFEVAV